MTLTYEWNNVEVNVPNNYGNEPHTHKEVRTIRHDYWVKVKITDIVDYLMPYDLTHKKNKTTEDTKEIALAHFYMEKAIDFLKDNTDCDLEDLENDEYFVEFMKERYEEEAWQDWEESNEEY